MISVMVVDDEKGPRTAIATLLKREGFRVHVARGGSEAVSKQRRTPASVICVDMKMPRVDGIQTAKLIRSFDEMVSFVGVTAFGSEYRNQAGHVLISDWIAKPVLSERTSRRLVGAVRRAAAETAGKRLAATKADLIEDLGAARTDRLNRAVRELNHRLKRKSLREVLDNPEYRETAHLALLYDATLMLKEAGIANELFAKTFFAEAGDLGDVVRALQEIRIAGLADDYEAGMKRFMKLIAK